METRRILWVSKNRPVASQIVALRAMFGDNMDFHPETRRFIDATEVARSFKEGNYHSIVIVAPLSVVAKLCEQGIPMLWSESVEENDPTKVEFHGAHGKGFRFVRFRRIKRVALEFED